MLFWEKPKSEISPYQGRLCQKQEDKEEENDMISERKLKTLTCESTLRTAFEGERLWATFKCFLVYPF